MLLTSKCHPETLWVPGIAPAGKALRNPGLDCELCSGAGAQSCTVSTGMSVTPQAIPDSSKARGWETAASPKRLGQNFGQTKSNGCVQPRAGTDTSHLCPLSFVCFEPQQPGQQGPPLSRETQERWGRACGGIRALCLCI